MTFAAVAFASSARHHHSLQRLLWSGILSINKDLAIALNAPSIVGSGGGGAGGAGGGGGAAVVAFGGGFERAVWEFASHSSVIAAQGIGGGAADVVVVTTLESLS